MLFLTNFLIVVVVVVTVLAVDVFGIIALAEWAGDKWGDKGFNTVLSVLLLLLIAILAALGLTYGA